jgi:hypothetical protein
MKIIYFGSSVPLIFNPSQNLSRSLIGSEAAKRRESHIFESLKTFNIESFELTFVSTAYGVEKSLCRNQVITNGNTKIVCLGYWGKKYFRHLTSIVFAFYWVMINYNRGDIAVTYNFPPIYALPILIKRIFGRRKLVIEFEDFHNPSDIRYYLFKPFEYLGIKVATAFLASSEGMKTHLSGLRPGSHIVVNGGYLPDVTVATERSEDENNKPFEILYSGSFDAERGVENLLGYFRDNNDQNFQLSFSGSGLLSDSIKLAAQKDDRLKYLGLLDLVEYADAIASADICINAQYSSISVNFPSKIATYLAFGKIVLSTEINSLVNSPYSDLLIFYDDQDPADFWKKLYFIKENIISLRSKSSFRARALEDILIKQERDFGNLIRQVSRLAF